MMMYGHKSIGGVFFFLTLILKRMLLMVTFKCKRKSENVPQL